MPQPDYMTAGRSERPVGITILSVLHVIGGVLGVLVFAFALTKLNDPQIKSGFDAVGIPYPLFLIGIGFLSVLALAAGIAMWLGTKWGWYLGSFYYAYSIATNLTALFSIGGVLSSFPDELGANHAPGPGQFYAKFGVRLVISILIYLYFFKQNVREYFGLQNTNKWAAIAIQFAVCIGIAIASTLAASAGS